MRCSNVQCPRPGDELDDGTRRNEGHLFSGYELYGNFHPECCPGVLDHDCDRDHPPGWSGGDVNRVPPCDPWPEEPRRDVTQLLPRRLVADVPTILCRCGQQRVRKPMACRSCGRDWDELEQLVHSGEQLWALADANWRKDAEGRGEVYDRDGAWETFCLRWEELNAPRDALRHPAASWPGRVDTRRITAGDQAGRDVTVGYARGGFWSRPRIFYLRTLALTLRPGRLWGAFRASWEANTEEVHVDDVRRACPHPDAVQWQNDLGDGLVYCRCGEHLRG